MQYKIAIALFISLAFLIACSDKKDRQQVRLNSNEVKQHLLNVNTIVVHNGSEKINEYIKSHQWKMLSTGTGLRYMIYENGKGIKTASGSIIKMKMNVEMLDSTVCYSAKDTDPVEFVINKSEQIRGLNELALLLKKGDKAKAILPPHLAYGLTGDNNNIPPNAVLVYDIEVLNVK